MSWDDMSFREKDSNWLFIEDPASLLSMMSSIPRRPGFEQQTEFGLQKYGSNQYFVYADGQPNGINTTLINCSAGSDLFPPSCQHRFLNGGRHFYFRHRPEDVPKWREMQRKILDLLASFEIRSTDTPLRR
jgi:hypothetical protein